MNNQPNNLNETSEKIFSAQAEISDNLREQCEDKITDESEAILATDQESEKLPSKKGQVIADQPIKQSLELMLEAYGLQNINIVMVEQRKNGALNQNIGLKDAFLLETDQPIILAAWQPEYALAENPYFHAVLNRPNVIFVRLPFSGEQLSQILEKKNDRLHDQLALDILETVEYENAISRLKHDLPHFLAGRLDEKRQQEFKNQAIATFGDLPENELIEKINAASVEKTDSGLAGNSYPDLCVDIEGTLLDENNKLRLEVLELIEEMKKERPITVWTGGDRKALATRVHLQRGLPYKVVSKHALQGAKVAIAIDDLTKEEFEQLYGVKVDKYINIEEIINKQIK